MNFKYVNSALLTLALISLSGCYSSHSQTFLSTDEEDPNFEIIAGSFSGSGYLEGSKSFARFGTVMDLVKDSSENLYVYDSNNCAIRKISSSGTVSTFIGGKDCTEVDGSAGTADIAGMYAMAMGPQNVIYAATHYAVRKIYPDGRAETLTLNGLSGGVRALAVSANGTIYIGAGSSPTALYKLSLQNDGTYNMDLIAGTGNNGGAYDGTGSNSAFWAIYSLSLDPSGNIYVADQCSIRKVTQAGAVTTIVGVPFTNSMNDCGSIEGNSSTARLPTQNLVTYFNGTLYITHRESNDTVHRLNLNSGNPTTDNQYYTVVAGADADPDYIDGVGSVARFYAPYGVVAGSSGEIYVSDRDNNAIRKITNPLTNPVVSLYTGRPTPRTSIQEHLSINSRFMSLTSLLVTDDGSVWALSDWGQTLNKFATNGTHSTISNLDIDLEGDVRMVFDNNKRIVIATGNTLTRVNADGTTTDLLDNTNTYTGGTLDGQSVESYTSLAIDKNGVIYFVDDWEHLAKATPQNGGGYAIEEILTNRMINNLQIDDNGNILFLDSDTGSLSLLTLNNGSYAESVLFTQDWNLPSADGDASTANIHEMGSGLLYVGSGNFYFQDGSQVRKIGKNGSGTWVMTTIKDLKTSTTVGWISGFYPWNGDLYVALDNAVAKVLK